MDEEKFSIDRFLELMGERDGKAPSRRKPRPGRRRDAFFRALRAGIASGPARAQSDTTQDVPASSERRESGENPTREAVGGGVDRREVLRAHALRGKPEDEPPTGTGKMFHVEHFERDGKEDSVGDKGLRSAEALSDNGSRLSGSIGRLVAKLRGVRSNEAAVVRERVEAGGKSADDGAFAGRRGAEVSGDEAMLLSDETVAHAGRNYRAEEAFRRGDLRRDAEFGEGVLLDGRSRGEKQIFAENDANLTESRSKIAEFRKSDAGENVDIRAISRAIERDARRY